jgi:hypothetical protein
MQDVEDDLVQECHEQDARLDEPEPAGAHR